MIYSCVYILLWGEFSYLVLVKNLPSIRVLSTFLAFLILVGPHFCSRHNSVNLRILPFSVWSELVQSIQCNCRENSGHIFQKNIISHFYIQFSFNFIYFTPLIVQLKLLLTPFFSMVRSLEATCWTFSLKIGREICLPMQHAFDHVDM